MIEFHLDGRSKVATYLQLVQQVEQALRVGLLQPGDQLPKVRQVAESLAINPNTVLKAYRELEHAGLVQGRQGLGTLLLRSVGAPTLASHAELRAGLDEWIGRARAAGLDDDDIVALVELTLRGSFQEGIA